jgi:hypothetical protein
MRNPATKPGYSLNKARKELEGESAGCRVSGLVTWENLN